MRHPAESGIQPGAGVQQVSQVAAGPAAGAAAADVRHAPPPAPAVPPGLLMSAAVTAAAGQAAVLQPHVQHVPPQQHSTAAGVQQGRPGAVCSSMLPGGFGFGLPAAPQVRLVRVRPAKGLAAGHAASAALAG